jgi:hypothetical protein
MCADKNKLYNVLLSIKAVNHEGLPSQSPLAPASALNHNKNWRIGDFIFFLLPAPILCGCISTFNESVLLAISERFLFK